MKVISTHAIDLHSHHNMTVLKETGQVVVSGTNHDHAAVILVLTLQGENLKEERIKPLCKHAYPSSVQSINTPTGEQLAILCQFCNEIKLLHLRTQKVTIACKVDVPKMACKGDQNRLYVLSNVLKSSYQKGIAELDCSEVPFKRLRFYPLKESDHERLSYAPSPYKMLITGNRNQTNAISCEKTETVWTLDNQQDSVIKRRHFRGVAFSVRHSNLFLCDAVNSRIFVHDSKDGSHLQTLDLPDMGFIYDLCPHDSKFIMVHYRYSHTDRYSRYCLSIISMN